MRKLYSILTLLFFSIGCTSSDKDGPRLPGLEKSVEIIRDKWGINHIYAQNQHDLFYAQGYAAAKDRLFQFEIWRRQATGTVAELLGPRELNRDIGTRLFMFRGDIKEELNYYHSDGEAIIQAYVDGVNAYIDQAIRSNSLPIEFELLGTEPQKWTPAVVISRHQGLLGNINQELNIGRAVAKIGADRVAELQWFHPKKPLVALDKAIDGTLLDADILQLYNAYRRPVKFLSEDLAANKGLTTLETKQLDYNSITSQQPQDNWSIIGSNNWVVSANKTTSGHTIMANDPHRTIAVPSLRYMVHLVAPGWNVIGGGEPEIPGISIGHNEYGAWGLTVFRTDGEDLYVYDLNPDNLNQYSYKGGWQDMKILRETIPIKGAEDTEVELKYTQHGPVTYIDSTNLKAYAVRCAWLEPGGSPYLASLRMDQASNWQEFREACSYSNIPGENMVWAGKDGTIGWQAVGIAPIRNNFSGLVPVPGDGTYEWDGYLPILEKPNDQDPAIGFIATANQNVTPNNYQQWNAVGYSWSDPYRGARVNEVLASDELLTMKQMQDLQTDYLSIPARILMPYLKNIQLDDQAAESAMLEFEDWDFRLEANSVPAAIYVAWENALRVKARQELLPKEVQGLLNIPLKLLIDWIENPTMIFETEKSRDTFLREAFLNGLADLTRRLGNDMSEWKYGQVNNKHVFIKHALGDLVSDELAQKINAGPLPRGGNGYTPGSTSSNLNQSSGGSFRMIVNTGDWDEAIGTNTPGQSGDPESQFYQNLFKPWANDEYFPILYSRERIEDSAIEIITYYPDN